MIPDASESLVSYPPSALSVPVGVNVASVARVGVSVASVISEHALAVSYNTQ